MVLSETGGGTSWEFSGNPQGDNPVAFDVMATTEAAPNEATVDLYNLPDDLRNAFRTREGISTGIELYAGYGEDPPMIFRGSNKNVLSAFDPSTRDWKTRFYSSDGWKSFSGKYFDKSYRSGADIQQIFRDIADVMGLPMELTDVLKGQKLLRGRTFSYLCREALDYLADVYSVRWSIQNGRIEVTFQEEGLKSDVQAVLLTQDTGILGFPTITERQPEAKKGAKKGAKKKILGIQCKCYIIPGIAPNRIVQIDSPFVDISVGKLHEDQRIFESANGIYTIRNCHYTGSTDSDDYTADISADII